MWYIPRNKDLLLRPGVIGGANIASYSETVGTTSYGSTAIFGYHIGGLLDIAIDDHFLIQPQLLFSLKGGENQNDLKLLIHQIEIPILVEYKFKLGIGELYGGLGPHFGIGLGAREKQGGESQTITFGPGADQIKRLDIGGTFTAGYLFENGFFGALKVSPSFTNQVNTDGNLTYLTLASPWDIYGRSPDFFLYLEKNVSHHLRHDKTCLNCGAIVEERFCTRCGQENLEPKESLGHLISHFFEDLTHFDGKFFVTVKDLVLKPGFLTHEYVAGRRARYLNPIRMYIFVSAMFFLALFAGSEEKAETLPDNTHAVNAVRQQLADSLRSAQTDSLHKAYNGAIAAALDTGKTKNTGESLTLAYGSAGIVVIDITENKYNTLREYDSVQHTLPDTAKEKGMMLWITRNDVRQKEKHGGRSKFRLEVDVRHDIPKIMFVLLPLFALYVGWFYDKKKYYYVNHAIFSVHFHSFVFLLFLFMLLLNWLIPWQWTGLILTAVAPLPVFIYLVAALHGMYRQSFWITLGKGLAISLIYAITFAIASTLLMISSLLRI